MMTVEIAAIQTELSFRQRWSLYLTLIFGGLGFLIGLNLRDSVLNATALYSNPQAGITAEYPQNWLMEEGNRDFVFRVRDTSDSGHNTTIQVAIRPVGPQTSARNIFDSLTLARAQTLAAYSVISEEPFILPDGTATTSMAYTFVSTQINPFLQNTPVVVEGIDILIFERGQVIIVSFLASADTFDENLHLLHNFLRSLES